MHIPRLYIPQPLIEHTHIELEPAAAHHVAKVLRMKPGREVILFNGQEHHGELGEFSAVIDQINKKQVVVELKQFTPCQVESSLSITLGVCMIKPDRMDWLLQKACELGVTSVIPLWSDFTDIKIPADRLEKKHHHWRQVLISACEQSGRVAIPDIALPQPLSEWVAEVEAEQCRVLHPYVDAPQDMASTPTSIALLVGPEGGLSEPEVALAIERGFMGMTLGPRILRAETAPLAAISLLQYRYGDF